jgi:hypothetical protein
MDTGFPEWRTKAGEVSEIPAALRPASDALAETAK